MIQNKIVARYLDGRVEKGTTTDFSPNKDLFHLAPLEAQPGGKPMEIRISDMKAVFFVRDFTGNRDYNDRKEFDSARPAVGRRIKVIFKDGELMVGTTQGYQPNRPGFFVVPADEKSNVERCFVVTASTKEVAFL